MTTTVPPTDTHAETSSALAARDWALILTPALAGVLIMIATITDPAPAMDGEKLARLYADNTDAQAIHTLTLHFGYGFWCLLTLLVPRLVRAKGAWLANIGAALGFLGIITLPGLVFTDFIGIGITKEFGDGALTAVSEHVDALWGPAVFALSGMPGSIIGPVIAAIALWRAGIVPWWGAALVVVGFLGAFGSGMVWWGGTIMAVALTAFSLVLSRAIRN